MVFSFIEISLKPEITMTLEPNVFQCDNEETDSE